MSGELGNNEKRSLWNRAEERKSPAKRGAISQGAGRTYAVGGRLRDNSSSKAGTPERHQPSPLRGKLEPGGGVHKRGGPS